MPKPSRRPASGTSTREDSLWSARETAQPLAARMRPRDLDEVVGQQHLLAEGKPLRHAIEKGNVSSMVFWGPPGSGKTITDDGQIVLRARVDEQLAGRLTRSGASVAYPR